MKSMKDITLVLFVVILSLSAIAAMYEFSFEIYAHYNPKVEQVRRETYEKSRAFREGTIRDLESLQIEYARGNDVVKAVIRATTLHRLADVPDGILTSNLIRFKHDMESAQ
jgi:hypothetical protein